MSLSIMSFQLLSNKRSLPFRSQCPLHWVFLMMMASALPSNSAVISSERDRFSIDVPASWRQITPPPDASVAAQSADNQKTLVVAVQLIGNNDPAPMVQQILEGAQQSAKDQGMEVKTQADMTVGGVAFRVFTAKSSPNPSMTARCGFSGGRIYFLSAGHGSGDVSIDSQIQGILNSFRPNSQAAVRDKVQPSPTAEEDPKNSASYRTGLVAGRVLALAIVGFALVRWLRRRSSSDE